MLKRLLMVCSRVLFVCVLTTGAFEVHAAPLEAVPGVEGQPLVAQVKRLAQALEAAGAPLPSADAAALARAYDLDAKEAALAVQGVLNQHVLVDVRINPESRVKVHRGPAAAQLVEQGWSSFLVRVHNEAGVRSALEAESPNAERVYRRSTGKADPKIDITPGQISDRWMDLALYHKQPMAAELSGLEVEYAILEIFSRDRGAREAKLRLHAGQGSQDIGFRDEVSILFRCAPSLDVTLEVKDEKDEPTVAAFIFRDSRGRVYPSQSRRLAPDFFFHPQVYRADGESVRLPAGSYEVECTRGPEYLPQRRTVEVAIGTTQQSEAFYLKRWAFPRGMGWYSGDHHIHGGGCSHYESPTAGVTPADMMRQILGEDLNVGCVLSWGPCWYFQKQYFDGKVHELSQPANLMRYDVEVSGFPSSHAGHLCLLRLKEDDYPGTTRIEEWPSWDLPVLQWGKKQGGVVGFSHSGWGLNVETEDLPNYVIPPYSGIGANEYIVDVVHDVVDFISAVDTPYVWELNIWYHTLNCGYRARVSGETDFPCIYGERVGLGRIYCGLDGELDFDRFCEAIRSGRSYVGDGRSHLVDFRAGGTEVGRGKSELHLKKSGTVRLTAKAAAYLPQEPSPDLSDVPYATKPYWHIERARMEGRKVRLEAIVNGEVAASKDLLADGNWSDVVFDVPVERSSWVALRILPSVHTNPIFVMVDQKPIRASKKSAQWCLDGVEKCWEQKTPRIREGEQAAARAAYDVAREAYRKILAECPAGS